MMIMIFADKKPNFIYWFLIRTFEIRHPEMIQVGRSMMAIFNFMSNPQDETEERQVDVSLLLTESVEHLDATTQAQGA